MASIEIEISSKIQNPDVPVLRRKRRQQFPASPQCHDCARPAEKGKSRCWKHARTKPNPKPEHLSWWVAESRECIRPTCKRIFIPSVWSQVTCSKPCGKKWVGHHLRRCRLRHPERVAAESIRAARKQTAKRRGMTEQEFESRVAAQHNFCPIGHHLFVGRGNGRYAPVRDHCHSTGLDRAILCGEHNRALGGFKDSPEELQAAISYVLEWREKHLDKFAGPR